MSKKNTSQTTFVSELCFPKELPFTKHCQGLCSAEFESLGEFLCFLADKDHKDPSTLCLSRCIFRSVRFDLKASQAISQAMIASLTPEAEEQATQPLPHRQLVPSRKRRGNKRECEDSATAQSQPHKRQRTTGVCSKIAADKTVALATAPSDRLTAAQFCRLNIRGARFWNCTFPEGIIEDDVREMGGEVLNEPPGLPFRALRAYMYTQEELQKSDTRIFQWFQACGAKDRTFSAAMAMALHDTAVEKSFRDYVRGKPCVAVMGGHGMLRGSKKYAALVQLSQRLAREGFLVVTGGGPGAMEAANLGAYLRDRSDSEVEEALQLLAQGGEAFDPEFLNVEAAQRVIARFGWPSHMPSLGIPTWQYGHEPPNFFATYQAKLFSNAVREDGIIHIANMGVIYAPGNAGTRQEVFQSACRNHYASSEEQCPMIFWDADQFWKKSAVFDVIRSTSEGREYHNWILRTDSCEAIVKHLQRYAEHRHFKLLRDEDLLRPWWYEKACPHTPRHF
eukprot:g68922.t1